MGDGDLVTGLFETYQLFRPRWWQVWRWVEWFRIPKRHRITLTITGVGYTFESRAVVLGFRRLGR